MTWLRKIFGKNAGYYSIPRSRHIYTAVNVAPDEEVLPILSSLPDFKHRHIGISDEEMKAMLFELGESDISHFCNTIVPQRLRESSVKECKYFPAISEDRVTNLLRERSVLNMEKKYLLGEGFYDCVTPAVIQRGILENPAWYTPYSPYQAEISQGRLESLFNFQTMVASFTGLPIANASLLDEGSAAAEAMMLLHKSTTTRSIFLVDSLTYESTLNCLISRAEPRGIRIVKFSALSELEKYRDEAFGVYIQYCGRDGSLRDSIQISDSIAKSNIPAIIASDILSLTLLKSPGEVGASVAVGSTQRFGMQLGYGGPYAAYFAAKEEYLRMMPGRLVGLSKSWQDERAFRLALQTREQHIRREKATSNICTSQSLPATVAAMYAIYHGPSGLKTIATRIHEKTRYLGLIAEKYGHEVLNESFFDTLTIKPRDGIQVDEILTLAENNNIALAKYGEECFKLSIDETVNENVIEDLICVLSMDPNLQISDIKQSLVGLNEFSGKIKGIPLNNLRSDCFLEHSIFNSLHSETALMRYIKQLEEKDLSLVHSMIPLGSCTMKLNSATEMKALTIPGFTKCHPYCSPSDAKGYQLIMKELEEKLMELTGSAAVCFQPNSGAQGELLGLLIIRQHYKEQQSGGVRDVCLVPKNAHGTNPASARLAGFKVQEINCNKDQIDLDHLREQLRMYEGRIAAIMITFPSTFGTFDERIILEAISMVKAEGALVYLDGANMNAMMGLIRPFDLGVDVMHLNLHKTFCVPHGGGGPGVGPVLVREGLIKYLPGKAPSAINISIGSSPNGPASLLPVTWSYIQLMGSEGLKKCSQVALLNANYMKKRLREHYSMIPNEECPCAHEFIINFSSFRETANIEVQDVAKRLQDYSFHSPTISWPVSGAMMIEPTESEGKEEIDRFCEAMIQIRREISLIETGKWPLDDNPLKNAPHTAQYISGEWVHPYSREYAAYPLEYLKKRKFWPSVSRINEVYGDVNFKCTY